MKFGKTIKLYLKDGNVTGIKQGEVVNQTIKAFSCPRNRLSELKENREAKKPGLYFLLGTDDKTSDSVVYIGEAENVYDRVLQHISKKDFWNEVILFVSKDDNLTKAHVKFLENRTVEMAKKASRYKIENSITPQSSSLPESDIDSMEEFLIYIKLLLGVLGHKILEPLTPFIPENNLNAIPEIEPLNTTSSITKLKLNVSGISASAIQTDEGIVVLENSEALLDIQQSLQMGYRVIREELINDGTLEVKNGRYIFKKNHLFNSASQAAGIIVGYSINGLHHWVNDQGTSLKKIEEEKLK
jgi:hypothetical protein